MDVYLEFQSHNGHKWSLLIGMHAVSLGSPFWLISYYANEDFFSKIINSLEIT